MPTSNQSVFRLLDANLNRLREGLRVVEDYCRLVDNNRVFAQLKDLRHQLQNLFPLALQQRCLEARQADADIGSSTFSSTEALRPDTRAVAVANLKRGQEAARVIEEYAKSINEPSVSQGAKALRFSLYTLEQEVWGLRLSVVRSWFPPQRPGGLYLVADEQFYAGDDFLADLKLAAAAGLHMLQLRQKRGDDHLFLQRARQLRGVCASAGIPFIVNDRPDIAVLAGADGLHLGQHDLPIAEARKIVGNHLPIGRSTHSLAQARAAVAEGADYIGFGPIFPTPSKENPDPVVGVDGLREVLAAVDLPVVAIGGIDTRTIGMVRKTGVSSIAVIRAVLASGDPEQAVKNLLQG
ncbi:MAG: thiamine phosphate synthase [Deltaproteobacteria bacterium]|nr:thiamine phosphate synthase [Candidatus Anaeroferrophillus wilburensis]MBN2888427.1 thiamine phosphate synthase [Deltaproteobacteria bacterium]